jgi:hypothetical protein
MAWHAYNLFALQVRETVMLHMLDSAQKTIPTNTRDINMLLSHALLAMNHTIAQPEHSINQPCGFLSCRPRLSIHASAH